MNKGFTLIELLAVIIIISLLGLLSIVSVGKIVGNSKQTLYENQISMIEKAARSWGAENIDKLPESGECIYLTLRSLKNYGLLSDNILDPRNNSRIDDNMKIKITTSTNTFGNLVFNYNVNATNVTNCRFMYGEYALVDGETFNEILDDYQIEFGMIKAVVFLNPGETPTGISREAFFTYPNADFSEGSNSTVFGFGIDDVLYIYSDGVLQANPNSSKMFKDLRGLISVDFSGLDTQNIVNMSQMFEGCSSLKSLDLSVLDTSNTTDVSRMFKDCISLRSLNLVGFAINRIVTYADMFDGCSNLSITLNQNIVDFITARLNAENIGVNLTIK